MKIKIFVSCEIQYFELRIFSFNSYVYYLSRGSVASARAFNLLTRTFNLPACASNLPTRAFNHATCAFSLLTRGFELVTCGFELVNRGFELVTRVLLFYPSIRKQIITIHILPNISRSNDDQTMKFVWLIEVNMKSHSLPKSQKLAYLSITSLKLSC